MANHRMFSLRIINSAKFLQMPESSQLLYFHLAMRADDDGIVEAYPVLKLLGTAPDAFKILIAKGFVIQMNDEQVTFLSDWREHNSIRPDRKVNSVYLPLLLETVPHAEVLEPKPRIDVLDNSKRVDRPWSAQVRLGKGSLGDENTYEIVPENPKKKTDTDGFSEFWRHYPNKQVEVKASAEWRKLSKEERELAIKDVAVRKDSKQWREVRFVPMPYKYLQDKRWTDEITQPKRIKSYG